MSKFNNLLEVTKTCDTMPPFPFEHHMNADECPVPFTFRDQIEHVGGYILPRFIPGLLRACVALGQANGAVGTTGTDLEEQATTTTTTSTTPLEFYLTTSTCTISGRPVSLAQAQQLLAQESPAGTVEQGRWAKVTLAPHLATYETRTRALLDLARALQKAGEFLGLQGWRDELYPVYGTSGPGRRAVANQAAFAVERAAAPIFGIQNFGAHINGYSYAEDGTLFMWAARRSSTKPTWPGMLDNMVAGGAPYNMGIRETVVKECQEEASIPAEVAQRARPAGVVSYIHHNPNGLQPEYQFVYDLQLPWDYDGLRPNDGEVEAFYLFSMSELRERLLAGEYKPNCALVCLDFMIRHGVLTPENEPDYLAIIQSMRRALPLPVPSFDVYRDRVH